MGGCWLFWSAGHSNIASYARRTVTSNPRGQFILLANSVSHQAHNIQHFHYFFFPPELASAAGGRDARCSTRLRDQAFLIRMDGHYDRRIASSLLSTVLPSSLPLLLVYVLILNACGFCHDSFRFLLVLPFAFIPHSFHHGRRVRPRPWLPPQ